MGTVSLEASSLEQTVERKGVVFIDWWAPWSESSRAFEPVFAAAADRHPNVTFGRVNVGDDTELASTWEVRSVPTIMVYRDGTLVFSHSGSLPEGVIDQLLEAVEALDMGEVHKGTNGHKRPRIVLGWANPDDDGGNAPAPERP